MILLPLERASGYAILPKEFPHETMIGVDLGTTLLVIEVDHEKMDSGSGVAVVVMVEVKVPQGVK